MDPCGPGWAPGLRHAIGTVLAADCPLTGHRPFSFVGQSSWLTTPIQKVDGWCRHADPASLPATYPKIARWRCFKPSAPVACCSNPTPAFERDLQNGHKGRLCAAPKATHSVSCTLYKGDAEHKRRLFHAAAAKYR